MELLITYLGKQFENPFVLASGPPTANAEMISRAFEAGWAGAVVKTLIREPVHNLQNRFASIKSGKSIFAFENIELLSEQPPDRWYQDIAILKKRFPDKVVIASIMGDARSRDPWVELALGCQDAGADILELNFSCPHGYPEKGKGAAIGQNAEYSASIVEWLKADGRIRIPIVPKLTAAVSDISFIGEAVSHAGADGICAINSFSSLMGIDLKTLRPKPSVNKWSTYGGYSGAGLKPIALRCVSQLVKDPGLPVMGCGGITTGYDAAEYILIGAPIVQVCTEVMLKGYAIVTRMLDDLRSFMEDHRFSKIEDFIGLSNKNIRHFSELDNEDRMKAHIELEKCNGCQRCYVSCKDGAYQAIRMENDKALVLEDLCAGCSLCIQVCPMEAISFVACEP
jgi:dihydropyrimidine dehydrogenase (NAD+) subunit PreA